MGGCGLNRKMKNSIFCLLGLSNQIDLINFASWQESTGISLEFPNWEMLWNLKIPIVVPVDHWDGGFGKTSTQPQRYKTEPKFGLTRKN